MSFGSAWCSETKSLASETKTWVSETWFRKVSFGNWERWLRQLERGLRQLWLDNCRRGLWQLGTYVVVPSMRNGHHDPWPPPPHPQYPLQSRQGQLLRPTKPNSEADKNQLLKPTKPVAETDKASC